MPNVSIIVPVYNVENYIISCIDSLINQTYKDIEIILVDDGSTDSCPLICDDYKLKDNRIKVLHKTNGGLSSARNAGLNFATGDYICFIDSDDVLHPKFCETLITAAIQTDALFSVCKFKRFVDETEIAYSITNSTVLPAIITGDEYFKMQINGKAEMGVCNKLFKRSIFNTLSFMNGRLHEDIIFVADMLSLPQYKVAFVDQDLYYYRQHQASIVNKQYSMGKCSSDRVFAGNYLFTNVIKYKNELIDQCLNYAITYPWYFVDTIYVKFKFTDNSKFLKALKTFLKTHRSHIKSSLILNEILIRRMLLFSKSIILYSLNAYCRLFRVYLYRVFKADPYRSGHGI